MLIVCTLKGNGDHNNRVNRQFAWGQHLHFHLWQRAVTPESKTMFDATGRITRVITSNPVIRRFESRLAQSSMAFANISLSSWANI